MGTERAVDWHRHIRHRHIWRIHIVRTPRRRLPRDPRASTADARLRDDARIIDERYGLEPVFEPGEKRETEGDSGGAGAEPYTVECPYCGEPFETLLDLSAGPASYIEDCRVCCQPIEFDLQTDAGGRLSKVSVRRGD